MLLDQNIPFRYLVSRIRYDILRVLAISAFFHILKIFFINDLPDIPATLPSILGTSISLLLAFELNQSYDRWWEARKIWGAIVNDSRILVTQLQGFVSAETGSQEILRTIAYRQIAWCYCLGRSLRKQDPLADLSSLVPAEELEACSQQVNKPLFLLRQHTLDIHTLYRDKAINHVQQIQLDKTITRLIDSMGRAERINSTVFPATYRRFIHFFIYLFLSILSLTLLETIGFYEIPLLALVASTFFLIERSAKDMQDPFRNKPTDTAVTAIARTIEINIKQLLDDTDIPAPLPSESFYLM